MKTKFKKGDRVTIVDHENIKLIGEIGEVCDVVPVFKDIKEAEESQYKGRLSIGEPTTGFYKVKLGSKKIEGYGTDFNLNFIK